MMLQRKILFSFFFIAALQTAFKFASFNSAS